MIRAAVRLVVPAVVLTVSMAAAGCGDDTSTRSPEAFCSTMRSEKARILAQLDTATAAAAATNDEFAGALIGIAGSLQAVGELRTYFAELSRVAPVEIQTEVDIVAASLEEQFDAAGKAVSDPLAAISQGLLSALTTSGQLNSVDSYARTNCGEGI